GPAVAPRLEAPQALASVAQPGSGRATTDDGPWTTDRVRLATLDGRHDQDLTRGPVELADRRGPPRAVQPERQPPRREVLGKRRLRRADRLGPFLVPLGQGQVAM